MAEFPLVSVIIPVHNRSDLLRECLESVAQQTYSNIQVIVVDDASTEEIGPVVRSLKWLEATSVLSLRLEKNQGPGGAREAGRQHARGDYIAYLDSDDLWHPRFVERNVENLQKNPDTDLSFSNCLILSEDPSGEDARIRTYRDGPIKKLLPEMFWGRNWITNSTRMWTRRATDKIGPWVKTWRSQDVNYTLRAGCYDIKVCHVPEVLAYYREEHGQDKITQGKGIKSKIEAAKAFLDAKNYLEDCGKLDDRTNAIPFAHLLFETAQSLLLLSEQNYASRCLDAAVEMSPIYSYVGFCARATFLLMDALSPYNAGCVARRLKYSLMRSHCKYYRD